jgi:uncharacterized membrane protein YhhN
VQVFTLVASLVALVAVLGNWWSRMSEHAVVELVTKPTATIAIALIGMSVAGQHDVPSGAVVAAIIGFAFCLAGDVALLPAVDNFIVGLAAFLLGHLAFVVMFIELGLPRWPLGLLALAGTAVVAAVLGRRIIAGARAQDASLVIPVCAYLTVISAMAVVGWATGAPAAIVGSALFVASDSILGWGQFVRERRWMPVAIMVTYHGALLGLALSLGS